MGRALAQMKKPWETQHKTQAPSHIMLMTDVYFFGSSNAKDYPSSQHTVILKRPFSNYSDVLNDY